MATAGTMGFWRVVPEVLGNEGGEGGGVPRFSGKGAKNIKSITNGTNWN